MKNHYYNSTESQKPQLSQSQSLHQIKQKSKSRSSSRSKSSSMRKRVSFDETPVEISREPSGSKLNQNGLVPNGIHLNHHTMGQKYKKMSS